MKIDTECKAPKTHGGGALVMHACQESTNLRGKGKKQREALLLRLVITSVV